MSCSAAIEIFRHCNMFVVHLNPPIKTGGLPPHFCILRTQRLSTPLVCTLSRRRDCRRRRRKRSCYALCRERKRDSDRSGRRGGVCSWRGLQHKFLRPPYAQRQKCFSALHAHADLLRTQISDILPRINRNFLRKNPWPFLLRQEQPVGPWKNSGVPSDLTVSPHA